jgi:hypothetical protein
MFSQQLNGAVFLAIAQTLFENFSVSDVDSVQGIDASVVGGAALRVTSGVSPSDFVLSAAPTMILCSTMTALACSQASDAPAPT